MKPRARAVVVSLLTALSVGCSPAERYDVLAFFFDGVPAPPVEPAEGAPNGHKNGTGLLTGEARKSVAGTHGPFGARLCSACHLSAANNTLVAPREQLCFQCHDLKLDKAYVHGPLASGGCTVCHDPHQARYRYLLVADSATFCLRCHEKEAIDRTPAHRDTDKQCTACHDAHQSNQKFLLK